MKVETNPMVNAVFENYPLAVKEKMQYLRELVLDTAAGIGEIKNLEETLRWGEPSFITKTGSSLRMDWKDKTPNQYQMYFQCTTRLVETFKLLFGNKFHFEGKRAIVFHLDEDIAEEELRQCIKATLLYHLVKNEITLGI